MLLGYNLFTHFGQGLMIFQIVMSFGHDASHDGTAAGVSGIQDLTSRRGQTCHGPQPLIEGREAVVSRLVSDLK